MVEQEEVLVSLRRWAPRQTMIVDPTTKLDPTKGMNQLVKAGWLSIVDVPRDKLESRKADVTYRRRSHRARPRGLQ